MGFLKKIKFWKKRNNNTPTKVDACVSIRDPRTCDPATLTMNPTKVDACVSTEDPQTCNAATVTMDPTVTCAAYTQTETRMDVGSGAAKEKNERELAMKTPKIRELEEELAVSKKLTTDLMLYVNSVEQQLRKYAEEPAISWSDDCECKQQVSAVADLLKKFITKKSKAEATSGRNTKVDCETQTEANSRQRDCASADGQEIVRRLEEKNSKPSTSAEEYERKIALLNEEMEHMLQDRTSHIHYIKMWYKEENQRQLLKMRFMRDELLWYMEQLPGIRMPTRPTGEDDKREILPLNEEMEHMLVDHQQNKRSGHTGRREAGESRNRQHSANQRHCPNDFGRNRNLPPRLQNRK